MEIKKERRKEGKGGKTTDSLVRLESPAISDGSEVMTLDDASLIKGEKKEKQERMKTRKNERKKIRKHERRYLKVEKNDEVSNYMTSR